MICAWWGPQGQLISNEKVAQAVNRCKCCCETFQTFYRGGAPVVTCTAYIAAVDDDACIGCEACADICPMEAVHMAGRHGPGG